MEILANELILDIFEYLSTMDLIHSFNGLNQRFDSLIVDYFHLHKRLDFRQGTKTDIQLIRRRYLPSFIDQIEDLHLSDADTNPHEIDFFLSRLYPFYRFENVRSISLEHLYSLEKLDRLIDDFQRLAHLTDLQLRRCFIQADQQSILALMNKIWSLPQLITLHLGISFNNHNHFIPPTIISCSIRQLVVQGTQCLMGNLSLLYENTPSLESLSLKLWNVYDDEHELNRMPTLTKFSCQCDDPSVSFATLFRQMPNLTDLSVQTQRILLDGKAWQSIIARHLLLLKNFQLRMEINLDHVGDAEGEINRIVSSFRTSFWIAEHHWFIRCFWNEEAHPQLLYLHTLPYAFKHLALQFSDDFCTQTTCPDEDSYQHYHSVTNLTYSSSLADLTDLWHISFLYLRHLSLAFPLTDSFAQSIPRLDRLKSLEVRIADWADDYEDLSQVQSVLDQAPRLFSLRFHSWPTSSRNEPYQSNNKKNSQTTMKMAPFNNEHAAVRQLDLRGFTSTRPHHCYNEQHCATLSRSPLGRQCEYLQIEVEKRTNILDLVKKMPKLRTLNVRCRDRKANDQELIKWLHDRLPSSASLAKDSLSPDDIRIWIR